MKIEECRFSPLLHMWKHLLLHIWEMAAGRKLLQISKLFMQNSSCPINRIQTSLNKVEQKGQKKNECGVQQS